jgi:Ca-activated chloride channel family protein
MPGAEGVQCRSVSLSPSGPWCYSLFVLVSFVSLVVAAPRRIAAQQSTTFRTGVDLVNIGVTVTDRKGNLVTDLTAEDFQITEDGRPQTLSYFAAGDRADASAPELHLGLLLDVSESMGEDIAFTRTAAIKFLNTLTDAVDITVVDFDTQVRVGRYGQSEFARLVERIRQQKTAGNTALYDAIGVYLDGAAGQAGRKIMLLYTDGGDTRSVLRFGELLNLLKASDVTVYVIGQLQHQTQAGKGAQRPILQQIAEATGGQAFFPLSVKNLDAVYERVLAEIRAQYILGYLSTNDKLDGNWRKVETKVVRKDGGDYRIRSRKGYYALFRKP